MRETEVIGVVLAGGESRRMGRDKTAIRVDGETLVDAAVRRLRTVTADVLVADRGRELSRLAPSVVDGPGRGPAAGLLGAAAARPGRALLALACDLPRVPTALLAFLARQTGDWIVPVSGLPADGRSRLEPLCALYRPGALCALAARVGRGDLSLHGLTEVEGLDVRALGAVELEPFGDPRDIFLNLNHPSDLAALDGLARLAHNPRDR